MNIAPHNLNLKSNLITLYLVALYSTVEHWPSRERPDVLQSVTEAQAEALNLLQLPILLILGRKLLCNAVARAGGVGRDPISVSLHASKTIGKQQAQATNKIEWMSVCCLSVFGKHQSGTPNTKFLPSMKIADGVGC